MRIAIYARVSTRHQQNHTIDQQLARLRAQIITHADWSLAEEHIFCDQGYSGASLQRPALDRLRDQAAQAAFDLVFVTSPDRLARNYVHQMLLLEEFARSGCQIQFLDQPVSHDPHDHLLLQIRGAVAEYERTLIAERMRRGRLARLRSGQLLPWTRAPYGYRLHPERPRDPALLATDAVQAAIIQELFHRYADGGVSLYGLAVELTERQILSPAGRNHWTANTIRLLLSNPCYMGVAYGHRTQIRPSCRRASPLQPIGRRATGWTFRPHDEWIGVPIPALVDHKLFARVQERLATNQQMARRSTTHDYLLRGLVSCGHCRLRCHGRFRAPAYTYYICRGKQHAAANSHDQRCRSRQIPAGQLEQLVWQDLCEVIRHPELIACALERAQSGAWEPETLQQRLASLQGAQRGLERQRERLLATYLAEAIELTEFERRQRELAQQREDLAIQERQLAQYKEQLAQVQGFVPSIEAMCERLQSGLAQATPAQQRQLIELLVDCIVVTDEHVEIRYVIPTTQASSHIRFCHLRKDYFLPPATGILHKAFLRCPQAGNQIPYHGPMPVARQFVATDVRTSLPALPDSHLLEEAPTPRSQGERTQRLPAPRCLDLSVGTRPKYILPAHRLQTGQKGLASMDAVGQHNDPCLAGQIVGQSRQQVPRILGPRLIGRIHKPAKREGHAIGGQADPKDAEIIRMARLVNGQIEFARRHLFEQLLNEGIVHRGQKQAFIAQDAPHLGFVYCYRYWLETGWLWQCS
jgi:site-specific DNA recombinase